MKWFIKVLKHYADFDGRARRMEYWMFTLFTIIIGVVVIALDNLFGVTLKDSYYGPFYFIFGLALFVPTLAVTVRRLHDTGKSGFMILIAFIPIIGGIWLLVLMIIDSDIGENKYGPNPKELVIEEKEG